jgi:hypothetical protein
MFDILVDKNAKPWLLDVGVMRSFNISQRKSYPPERNQLYICPVMKYVKSIILSDAINLIKKSNLVTSFLISTQLDN